MSIKNLRYWVFTSGERGIHGLDWGIKHASEYFSDRQQLDTEYRALLKEFGLLPSLERPAKEVGLILLRWKGADFIAGFIFAGTDHGDRPNTSSVICVIPSELVGRKSVNELIRDIWAKNNIAEIARKNSQCRPDTLRLEGDSVFTENVPYFKSSVSWPSDYNGWLQIDGKQRELLSVNASALAEENKTLEVKKTSGRKLKNIFLVLMIAAVACGAYRYFVTSSGNTPANNQTWNGTTTSGDTSPKPTVDSTGGEKQKKIDELREKLARLLKGGARIKGKPFTVRIFDWDNDKEKLSDECSKLMMTLQQSKGISPKKVGGTSRSIEFPLRGQISEDATIDECIEAFLSQIQRR